MDRYCAAVKIPLVDRCMPMADWSSLWSSLGTLGTLVFGTIGAVAAILGVHKVLIELRNLKEQKVRESGIRAEELALKRTQFFLAQHRRLFEDPDLASVLQHLDGDGDALATPEMADKNRKFLTFIEEIALLVNSSQIKPEVAFYMFGWYARCARNGSNFNENIDTSEAHWAIFQAFADDSAAYAEKNPQGPQNPLTL
ncbi:hypothetical protein LMG1873_05459 [Achromobacter piechaudii]|uniref:DUF4760 domain-containing protein n=2 Tax=Achromobacter piechaudii TaxID=72556 RepID=A0ABM8L618_9BURK|nr:hypothetical protein LMG1873_05459 [Achromobacter piechaudii]CAB3921160.1 hypothetical protein LMG2828_05589 [Achromobacter piechaudii]CAB3958461.1 hypothetical protein LMG6103_05426 [Achromobacter piechaudii]